MPRAAGVIASSSVWRWEQVIEVAGAAGDQVLAEHLRELRDEVDVALARAAFNSTRCRSRPTGRTRMKPRAKSTSPT